jgi:hypothetical protein
MNSWTISYAAGCENCRQANMFISVLISNNEIESLSRTELQEKIDQSTITCPECGEEGYMNILFFKINDIIYDMEYPPVNGRITLEAEKRNGQIVTCKLVPNTNGFGSYDCLNTLNTIQKNLALFHNNWLTNEKRNPDSFQSRTDGVFWFPVKFIDEPPYISIKGYSSQGFSFEEMNSLILKLRREITDVLTRNNMLY